MHFSFSKLDKLTAARNRGFFDDSTVTFETEADRTSEVTVEENTDTSSSFVISGDGNNDDSLPLNQINPSTQVNNNNNVGFFI